MYIVYQLAGKLACVRRDMAGRMEQLQTSTTRPIVEYHQPALATRQQALCTRFLAGFVIIELAGYVYLLLLVTG